MVRKDLVRRYSRQYPVPTYVVEFLLGRYCATTDEQEIEEGLAIVERQLADRTVRTGDEELFKARARDRGAIKLIDIVKARLDARTDSLIAELPSLALRDVRIGDNLVKQHERMLTDGFYAEVTLSYDAAIAQERKTGVPLPSTASGPFSFPRQTCWILSAGAVASSLAMSGGACCCAASVWSPARYRSGRNSWP